MMKVKVTHKEINNKYNNIIRVGYSDLQHLLKYEEPFAYSSGVYGWSCDYYNINGTIIKTGYNTMGKNLSYKLVKTYDDLARTLDCKDAIDNLLDMFIADVVEAGHHED